MIIFTVKRTSDPVNYDGPDPPCDGAWRGWPEDDPVGPWAVSIVDLDHLLRFISENGKCVISQPKAKGDGSRGDGAPRLEICDDYRE